MFKNLVYDLNCIRKLRMSAIPVIIYQMGKVGSKSVHNSLRAGSYGGGIFHTHTLRYDHVRRDLRRLYEYVHLREGDVRIITMTRDPFRRNISSFFQRLPRHVVLDVPLDRCDIDDLIKAFIRKYDHFEPVEWFDRELRRVTGLNIYEHRLQGEGFVTASSGNVQLLALKCEMEDAAKSRLIREFLELPEFELQRANVSSDKGYGRIYEAFMKRIAYPKKLVDEIAGSRYFNHFYAEERAKILEGLRIRS
jgi:hypothetical protein